MLNKDCMSSISGIFKEYIWLVNTIRRSGKITFEEIQEKWLDTDMSEGVELAKSTFHRHKDAIADIFGIYVECDRNDEYRYYIDNAHVLQEETVQNWMLSTLSVNNIVGESLALQNRILLEPVPCNEHLQTIIEAMKRKVRIEVTYRRYGSDTLSHSVFEPYCIKLFKQRWYVLGHFHRDATPEKEERDYFATFSFDRIVGLQLTSIKFEIAQDFDAKAYFDECWGVLVDDGTSVEKIVVRAYDKERFYLRDLPLHSSQKSIAMGENYEDFELRIRPTYDFCCHILSKGNQLKVLSPQSLVEKIQQMLKEALEMYKK